MRMRCPTCGGLGKVPKAMPAGTVMGYVGPEGENWPMEFCQTCGHSGWVDMQVVPSEPEKMRIIDGQAYWIVPGAPNVTSTVDEMDWESTEPPVLTVSITC